MSRLAELLLAVKTHHKDYPVRFPLVLEALAEAHRQGLPCGLSIDRREEVAGFEVVANIWIPNPADPRDAWPLQLRWHNPVIPDVFEGLDDDAKHAAIDAYAGPPDEPTAAARLTDLIGLDPNLTGGLDPTEYVRRQYCDHPAAILAVIDERARQDARWGEQNHPDGTDGGHFFRERADWRRKVTQAHAAEGTVTWLHILDEEVHEAYVETDPAALRSELVQVAAVAVAWIEAIDRRTAGDQAVAA